MNTVAINKAIRLIARNLVELAKDVLDDDNVGLNIKVGRNTLTDSDLKNKLATVVEANDDPVITALFNNYVVYLEWHRPPMYGKRPPIDSLKEWASKNGIPTDAGTLWVISNAIWRDGHAGRPIFSTLDKKVAYAFDIGWSDQLFDEITNDLDNLFND